ncbi:MAG: RagB/SusD family nutrient uptake outer membrane protein [Oscillospiraceae bacterium]|jgi:hypothetical protein|nr:RagB/SusD family nutrient uptake outer membrane protein [Oscillospiraceae bacterium]
MKRNVFIRAFVTLSFVFALNACNEKDSPIVEDPGTGDPASIFDDVEADAVLNSAWRPYQRLSSTFSALTDTPTDGFSDYSDTEEGDEQDASQIKIEYTNWYPCKIFNALYQSIGIVNGVISKINVDEGNLTPAGKIQALARAKFQRGLYYLYLVQFWGEVPILLENGGSATTRASISDVYTQIVKDLKDAAAGLPAGNGLTKPTNPTKGAANALLARAYLAWGNNPLTQEQVAAIVTSKTDPAVSYNRPLLDSAVVYADKVINSSLYSLLPDFRNLWGRANESKGPEQIFTIHHDGDGIDAQGNHQTHCANHDPWNEDVPPHLQAAHEYTWWPDHDPRKAFAVLTSLKNPVDDSVHIYQWPHSLPRNGKGVDRSYPNSEYLTQLTNDVDRIEIRYAEVLITKAEALVQLNKDNAEATRLINLIRTRGFDGNSEHNYTSVTLQNIQDEWEFEFQYEQHRWLNLTRWKNLISTVLTLVPAYEFYKEVYANANDDATYQGITHKVGTTFARYHKHLKGKVTNIRGRNYRFPIPLGFSSEDLGIRPQNPGYGDPVGN